MCGGGGGGEGVTPASFDKALKVGNQIVHLYLKSNTVRKTLFGLASCITCTYTICLSLLWQLLVYTLCALILHTY